MTKDEKAIPESTRRLLDKEGIRGIKLVTSKKATKGDAYLYAVQILLAESLNALELYGLASDIDMIPDKQPSNMTLVDEIVSDGPNINVVVQGNRHNLDVSAYEGTDIYGGAHMTFTPRITTTWEEFRELARPTLLRSLWGYALVKFCAAMPRPRDRGRKGRKEETFRARHTARWLAKNRSLEADFHHFWRIRNNQEAHASRTISAERKTIVPKPPDNRRVLFTNWQLKADASPNYDPKPSDGDRLSRLVLSAWGFACASLTPIP